MENQQTPVPKWLQALQDNSWEIELLISGGAVFTLLQAPDLFLDWIQTSRITSDFSGGAIYIILGILGIKILTNGFILHLFLRSFWLAMVCINFVFPQGINTRMLKQKPPFFKQKEGDLQAYIMKVDRLSGLVIFMTILSTIAILGFSLIVASALVFNHYFPRFYEFISDYYAYAILIYLVDLFSAGFLRRVPYLSYLLFPVFYFFDILSLRLIYSRPLSLFSTNVRWKFFISGSFIFLGLTLVTVYLSIYRIMHWPNVFDTRQYKEKMADNWSLNDINYEDKISEHTRLAKVHIPSLIIENNYLQVSVRYTKKTDDILEIINPEELENLESAVAKESTKKVKKEFLLSNLYEITIDDSLYKETKWNSRYTPDISEIGIINMIDISHLKNGPHKLIVRVKPQIFDSLLKTNIGNEDYLKHVRKEFGKHEIPFWKDVF
jgi:hypothetical protein